MAQDAPGNLNDAASVSFLSGSSTPPAFTEFGDEELQIFDTDLKRLEASIWSKSGQLTGLWADDRDTLLWAAQVAKKQLNDNEFRGLKALGSSTFGMQPIRSIIINTTQTWQASYTATGWTASTWDVNLANTTGTVRNTQNRVVLCATRYVNYAASPKVKELRNVVGPTTYPIEVLEWAYVGGIFTAKGIGAVLVGKNGTFTTNFNVEFTGVDATAQWGLAFAQGDWLNLQT
jgi:hypothetical protein